MRLRRMMVAGLFKSAAGIVNLPGAQIAAPAPDIAVEIGIRALRCARAGGAVLAAAQSRRLLSLGRRPTPRCALTAVGRV